MARIGGSFPFNPAGSFVVALAGGQYFYPPAGSYLAAPITTATTVIQWWDPVTGTWRNLFTPHPISFDGYNFRVINLLGTVTSVTITAGGTGGTNGIGPTQTGTSLTFTAPGGNGLTASGYVIIGGALSAPTITTAGSGFVAAPIILIDPPPPGGIQATATAAINPATGVLAAVTLVNAGAGYLTPPTYYVVPQFLDYPGQPPLPYTTSPTPPNFPPGQIQNLPPQIWMQGLQPSFPIPGGALVTSGALTSSGIITGIVITRGGSLHAAAPTVATAGGALGGTITLAGVIAGAAANDSVNLQMFIND
jgi:hypothetical protein